MNCYKVSEILQCVNHKKDTFFDRTIEQFNLICGKIGKEAGLKSAKFLDLGVDSGG